MGPCLRPLFLACGLVCLLASTSFAGTEGQRVQLSTGDCSTPGELVAELGGVATVDDALSATMQPVTEALGKDASRSGTTVPMSLVDLAASGHAVRVLDGEGATMACGELGAFEPGPMDLQLGLAPGDGATVNGVAWLHDNRDGTTTVSVVLGPAPSAVGSAEMVAVMQHSLYEPNPLEIAAGTTVTWVNEDALPHTITATDGAFDSSFLLQGDTWSHAFDAPGTYPIYCVIHPRMRGTVIVA